MKDEKKAYLIRLRLRRIVHEDAYIAVPVTDAIMKKKKDGSLGMDFEKFAGEGIKLGKQPNVEWKIESVITQVHPVQKEMPGDRNQTADFFSKKIT